MRFAALKPSGTALSTAYFIWRKPYMLAGPGTFIDDMLTRCGLENAAGRPVSGLKSRYPEITPEELTGLSPALVFLSSEPYPFREKHKDEIREILPGAKIFLVNGEMFSWYGSRLLNSPEYFNNILSESF